jgi:branched-chain amino acid transport system ATP-binding protein
VAAPEGETMNPAGGGSFLAVNGLVKHFGGLVATDNLSLAVSRNETHALIGPNGAGKTTLVSQLQGELRPDRGVILFDGQDITRVPAHRRASLGIARSFQISSVFHAFSALENVMLAVQSAEKTSARFWRDAHANAAVVERARTCLDMIGLAHRADVTVSALSHGERRQLELAMALAMKPRLLLLDEPLAGMGRQDGQRITEILRRLKKDYTIILIEHDMDVVFALADRISVLVAGRCVATGTPEQISQNAEVKAAYLGEENS